MIRCLSCGAESPDGVLLCSNCSSRLIPAAPPTPTAQPVPQPTNVVQVAPQQTTIVQVAPQPTPARGPARPIMLAAAGLAIIVVVVIAMQFLVKPQPASCAEDWSCGAWSQCSNGQQTRVCTDSNSCGTNASRPAISQQCFTSGPTPGCKPPGEPCQSDECCNYCVHGVCSATRDYCGDSRCDASENCSACPSDCGICGTAGRALEQNIFTAPLAFNPEQDFKNGGYVIVRYFYSTDCPFCYSPFNIEEQLRGMAASFKDLFVLILIDTDQSPAEANKYAKVGGTTYTPLIRVDGKSGGVFGYNTTFGYSLSQKLEDGDVIADVAPLICAHSDYCDFKDGKIVRV